MDARVMAERLADAVKLAEQDQLIAEGRAMHERYREFQRSMGGRRPSAALGMLRPTSVRASTALADWRETSRRMFGDKGDPAPRRPQVEVYADAVVIDDLIVHECG